MIDPYLAAAAVFAHPLRDWARAHFV